MALGQKTGGRQKGTPNKTTATVKSVLEETFERMGGVDAMHAWASENPTEFFKIYAKLLPVEMKGEVKHTGLDKLAERLARAAERDD